jgi:fatty-acyl-CoA synthase
MNFASLLDHQAAIRPGAQALVCGPRTWTFAEAARQVRDLAAALRAHGVAPGDRVAVVAGNDAEYPLVAMAVYRAGAVLVPLNFRLAPAELAALLARSGARAVCCAERYAETVAAALADAPEVTLRVTFGDRPRPGWLRLAELDRGGDDTLCPRDAADPQRIMFTSGTTSRPKGVTITHGAAALNAHAQVVALDVRPGDRVLVTAPFHHVGGADLPGLGAWLQGATLVLQPRFDPDETLRLLAAERVTGTTMVQTMLHLLRRRAGGGALDGLALRWVLFGALPVEVCRELAALLPGVRLIRGYGMTETLGGVCYLPDVATAPPERAPTAGWPLPFVEIRTVDPDGRPTPPGVPGEIVVRGAKVTAGYWNDPEETARAIRDGWLHTGDVGVLAEDGTLRITDRIKDMIRSGGENIASAEVEEALYGHPAVLEAAVVGVPHERWVEVPKAYVVAGCAVTADELIAHCRGRLAGFKVPREIEFVEALPRNSTGKVDKSVLRRAGRS